MGHSHAVSQKQTHDNPELIAAAVQFSRICLVVSEPIVVPSAANERLALVQKDFAAYEYSHKCLQAYPGGSPVVITLRLVLIKHG